MKVIHGIWTPENHQEFIQGGQFSIWVETDEVAAKSKANLHPQHLPEKDCLSFLKDELAISPTTKNGAGLQTIKLPSYQEKPLPAPELAEVELNDDVVITLEEWQVFSCNLAQPLKDINNIHFLSCYQATNTRIGSDFLFWYYFSQSLKTILYKDQYIPALLADKHSKKEQFYRHWKIISPQYEGLIQQAATQMPLACSLGYQPESLLRHFTQVCLTEILEHSLTSLPQVFVSKIQGDALEDILSPRQRFKPILLYKELHQHYLNWQQKFSGVSTQTALQLGFQLYEAAADTPQQWQLEFFLSSHQDLSFKFKLDDFWQHGQDYQALLTQQFGSDIAQQILVQLAQAAKIYPKLWAGMETSQPDGVNLNLDEAFEFLKENAWVLEDAGFKIIIPAWLTPKGRQRAKLRLRSSTSKGSTASAKSYLSLENLIDYQYELAIGDEPVSIEERQQLV